MHTIEITKANKNMSIASTSSPSREAERTGVLDSTLMERPEGPLTLARHLELLGEDLLTVISMPDGSSATDQQMSGHHFSEQHFVELTDAPPHLNYTSRHDLTIDDSVLREASVDSSGTLVLDPPAASGPLNGAFYLTCKRMLDVSMSITLLILLSPLLLISALLVKLTDGGSIFYPHTRVGEGGNEFTCYKFRSMIVNAEQLKENLAFFNSHDDHRTFKIPNDPRVTWYGRWMRRTSIDELPQLWNVLKGEMSVVGPRPPVVSEVENYTWDDMQRLTVKPGLTCIWQVSGRSRLPFPEQLKLDLQYIENRSLALDLKLIALTVPAVLSADGAY